jgi:N-acetylmuramic acid 6-phosphate etherase
MEKEELFQQLQKLSTEQRNPTSMDIDAKSIPDILTIINNEDKLVALAVEKQIPYITSAVELVVNGFNNGGRLIYVGAGTSGRVGVVDASECPPTFGVPSEMVQGLIAGGDGAMFRAVEGAEDSLEDGAHEMDMKNVGPNDVVCGIAASMRTLLLSAPLSVQKKEVQKLFM